jgi:hypothetical protein
MNARDTCTDLTQPAARQPARRRPCTGRANTWRMHVEMPS